ncbi:MAG: hypothetical protein FJ247_06045 [Nitrospira sp.]|nr:hypothetical protein [Nitrospira sp.]
MPQKGMIWTLHRRLGLVLGPAVLLWFLSGAILLWVPYPSLTEEEWFSSSGALSARECCGSFPSLIQKLERPEGIESLRLRMVGDRPVVVAQGLDGSLAALSADSGEVLAPFTQEGIEHIVQPFAGGRTIDAVELIDHDVWTVHQRFDPYRPLWKVQLSGERRSVLYVSSVTGDVVQDTTAEERRWNLVGAVIHWWYWPWLRRHWAWWDQLVWWLSGIGTVMVGAGGLILGREWVKHGWSGLFIGRWRVHRVLGVIAGISACCWMASGWLSMDHGRWFSDGKVSAEDRERFMGGRLTVRDVEAMPDFSTMLVTGTVKETRLTKLAGLVHFIARTSPATQAVLTAPSHADAPQDAVSDEVVMAAARSLLGDGVLTISTRGGNDSHGCSATATDAELPFLQVETDSHESRGLLVDGRIGAAMERLDSSRRLYHQLFNSLHRWDVSWLSEHCDLRRMLMLLWCVCGAGLAGSGIWAGFRRPQVKSDEPRCCDDRR